MEPKRIEHYVINGDTFYHIDNGDIFDKSHSGFQVWCGGSGIGFKDSIEAARELIYEHSKESLTSKIEKLKAELLVKENSLKKLGDDKYNIQLFRNQDYHGYECNYFNGKEG